jgi:hypothetical protein
MFRALGILGCGVVLVGVVLAAPVPDSRLDRHQCDALWADLLSPDEQVATVAALRLAADPDSAVEYLRDKLPPVQLTKERAKTLIEDLVKGGRPARFAFEELHYFDFRLALKHEEQAEAMLGPAGAHLCALLCETSPDNFPPQPPGAFHWNSPDNKRWRFHWGDWIDQHDVAIYVADIGTLGRNAAWVRAVRAVGILEHIGTPPAQKILEGLATGHPDAAPTKAAKRTLERLKK